MLLLATWIILSPPSGPKRRRQGGGGYREDDDDHGDDRPHILPPPPPPHPQPRPGPGPDHGELIQELHLLHEKLERSMRLLQGRLDLAFDDFYRRHGTHQQ
ncbi:E4 [Miniopterus schreibersii papillomavirus 1]|uniref:E4 n=1 Tax=Miniopterus schreibersii papillomavirus 1 TaxID=1195364 RepID=J9QS16_9PAPI|nr:E4 [Miniopterus schreibersii papillomavirus 1]AFR33947.1 E4 [Miniopterus schreibersii papillomavirus 1]